MSRDLFWTLLETEHPRAEAFCRKLTGNRDDGDDLYQDVLLKAWRKFPALRNLDSFRPWLYRIIVNMLKSHWRKKRLENPDRDIAGLEYEASNNPSDRLNARRWLERAFAGLSPNERALITLFELEGWSIAELSEMYGRPVGTIKSRLARARKKMRNELGKCLTRDNKEKIKFEAEYALPRSKTSPE
jgi:RNA polymerase sigma-70 factor (ECF subfamily)